MLASYDSLFVGGEWVRPSSSARIEVTSASAEENIGSVPEAAEADVDAAVAAARRAFDDPDGWSQWEPSARAAAIERLAAELEARSAQLAEAVSRQNGMPISISTMLEGGFPVIVLRYLAGQLKEASFEEERPGFLGGTNIVRREPIGVVGAIVPWNYPQTLAAFKYGAALAAGCTVVMKPSPETLSVIAYDGEDAAIRIANDTDYGLGGSVWTADPEHGKEVARRVRTGTIGVNKYIPDPAAPFGGVKASGIGRELGPEAIGAYQQFKSIYT